ncbi:MAG: MerR family transcriptional regulator [Actinomycetota bacterium]
MYHQSMQESEPGYTIDELAQETGITARNIRAHQSRGLLPPPLVRGRTGYYGAEHLARLRLIREMQADGFNLRTIARVLATMPEGSAGEVLDLGSALRRAWEEEQPEIYPAEELAERLGTTVDALIVGERAARFGVFSKMPDGRWEVRSPALLAAGEALSRAGVSADALVGVQEELLRHADGVAKAFVNLFLEQVWKPFDGAGRPESEWPAVRAKLDEMIPIAHDSLAASFRIAMARHVEAALARVLKEQAKRA